MLAECKNFIDVSRGVRSDGIRRNARCGEMASRRLRPADHRATIMTHRQSAPDSTLPRIKNPKLVTRRV